MSVIASSRRQHMPTRSMLGQRDQIAKMKTLCSRQGTVHEKWQCSHFQFRVSAKELPGQLFLTVLRHVAYSDSAKNRMFLIQREYLGITPGYRHYQERSGTASPSSKLPSFCFELEFAAGRGSRRNILALSSLDLEHC